MTEHEHDWFVSNEGHIGCLNWQSGAGHEWLSPYEGNLRLNAHDALVAACEQVADWIDSGVARGSLGRTNGRIWSSTLRAAIAKAKGEA